MIQIVTPHAPEGFPVFFFATNGQFSLIFQV